MSSVNLQESIFSTWIFKQKCDIKRIHIVRRFTPVRKTTATFAVLASCDASPSGETTNAPCALSWSPCGPS